jgi:hypothetical protein
MSITEIHDRLSVLTQAAKERMDSCTSDMARALGGAEIAFMTSDELAERHRLMLMLPTFAEEAQAARARIQARIAQRKHSAQVSAS